MKKISKHIVRFIPVMALLPMVWLAGAAVIPEDNREEYRASSRRVDEVIPEPEVISLQPELMLIDTPITDTLKYPFEDNYAPDPGQDSASSLQMANPPNVETTVEYDPETGNYIITETVGGQNVKPPTYMTFDEYQRYVSKKQEEEFWKARSAEESQTAKKPLIPKLNVNSKVLDKIFGDCPIEIKPQGSAELIFGWNTSKVNNPALPIRQRKNTTFNFDQKIQMNVTGNIGCKMKLSTSYNTEATFDFDNQMKLAYQGEEDDIIQLIEAGNVNLPLTGSLIQGSQSLFGVKTALKFGRLTVTSIFSQQRGKSQTIDVQGGAQVTKFEIKGDNYEANKHYFLAEYFRSSYDQSLANLPIISSNIMITKVEVWVTNKTSIFDNTRNIVPFMGLGENPGVYTAKYPGGQTFIGPPVTGTAGPYPFNDNNNLYKNLTSTYVGIRTINQVNSTLTSTGLQNSRDYEALENARKLTEGSEFIMNNRLGYISLSTPLNADEVLAVAFQYTLNGKTYQVGEFSTDGIAAPNALILKMLKSTTLNPRLPMWDWMMKNVYALGAYQLNREDFSLNILYDNFASGTRLNYLPNGVIMNPPPNEDQSRILLKVMNLDRLNVNNDPVPDGFFDYVEGVTINSQNGRIFFPVIEPFGSHLRPQILQGPHPDLVDQFDYQILYDSTHQKAVQQPQLNRFIISGSYKSQAGSDIPLNAINVPQGSVTVTAGGTTLTEGADYTVDYTLGRVKIINQSILNAGTPISISLESQSMFNIQTKTLYGTHLDYNVSKDIRLGGTFMHMNERPLTQKVNIGDEPISNSIWGLDGSYRRDSRLLTKLVDKIPLINTKAPSSISMNGEFAQLLPGNARAIRDDGGISYMDDFEGTQTLIDIKNMQAWGIASTPQGQPDIFPEASLSNDLRYGMNRAKLAWYIIDPLFIQDGNQLTPSHITKDDQSNHFTRMVQVTEVFPNQQVAAGQINALTVFDMAYYPREKGPYNYDVNAQPGYTAGISDQGFLNTPESRWGGIMRKIDPNDFEAANIQFVQFWMMDPFAKADGVNQLNTTGGDFYINLGNTSEDILRDSRKAFENGLPTPTNGNATSTTAWGVVPDVQQIVNAFDNDPASRPYQDIGLDGLSDTAEFNFFKEEYLDKIAAAYGTGSVAYQNAQADASSDDYTFYRNDDYDSEQASILKRYKKYNNLEGNSPASESANEQFPTSATTVPNAEDVNRDNTLSESETYYQYKISLRPEDMVVGENYITDKITVANPTLLNGQGNEITWYQFRVPVRQPEKVVGSISDFRSIRFMRLFMRGFEDSVICRFAKMELVRGEWRAYDFSLLSPGEYVPSDNDDDTEFDIGAVNVEQNSNRVPVQYRLPPGIIRQQINQGNSSTLRQLNEQSLSLRVCGLQDGDARAAFKNVQFDVRRYKRFKMFVHAEQRGEAPLDTGDLTCFIRFGTDYVNNYYEYEIPLTFTDINDLLAVKDSLKIWPESNWFDFPFEVLLNAKQDRNAQGIAQTQPFFKMDGDHRITVMGNPNLANVRTAMIGIRNPAKGLDPVNDDGLPKCAEVWVNEMRLTDFNNEAGSAARLQAKVTLADFATVNFGTGYHTFGWGNVHEKLNQRSWTDSIGYDVSTTVNLDKFIPQKIGVKLPMFYSISESFSNPHYNPLNPDVELKNETPETQEEVKKIAQGYVKRESLNFTNVMRTRGKGIGFPTPIDISNFSATYAYTSMESRDINYEINDNKEHRGSLNYNYNPNPKNVRPFGKLKIMKKISDSAIERKKNKEKTAKTVVDSLKREGNKPSALKEAEEELALRTKRKDRFIKASDRFFKSGYLKPIKDFNFNYLPSNFGVRNDLIRDYAEQKLRNTTTDDLIIEATYNKSFLWNRFYTFKYDLTKALKIDFTAANNARIDEPAGRVDKDDKEDYDYWKDSVWRNVQNGGRTTAYQHATNVTYTLPINKLPILDFVNANVGYSSTYMWTAASLAALSLGNTISNSNTKTGNVNLNFTQLYNKVKYFKRAGQPQAGKPKPKPKPNSSGPVPDSLKTKEPGKVLDGIGITFSRLLISVKNASFTYNETNGTVLPGYMPRTEYLGLDGSSRMAPGWDFIFGSQEDIRYRARDNGWLAESDIVSGQYLTTRAITWNGRATVEPLPNLKVDLTMNFSETENHSEFFQWDPLINDFVSNSPMTNGSYTVSWNTFNTAFEGNTEDYSSEAFENLRTNRKVISDRLAARLNTTPGVNSEGFPIGYTATSQDVLIPAFLAAYSGKNANAIGLSPFPKMPKINWSAKYDGLSKLPFIKKWFKSIVFSHAYRSTYSVSQWMTNLNYTDLNGDGIGDNLDSSQNFIPMQTIQTVTISEQFSPFIGIDMTWNNSLITKFELKKSRNLSLSMANNQVTEVKSDEWVVGVGYRFKNVKFPIKLGKGKKAPVSDVNVRADLSIRDNRTIIRKIVEGVNQPTAGQKLTTIKFSADYVLSPRFNIRAFYDRIITKPVISSSFPTDNTNAGIALRFTLAQ